MKKFVCYIDWEDACFCLGEELDEVIGEALIVRTFGILEHKDENHHIVMVHDGGSDEDSDRMRIPTSLVRKVVKLKEV